MSSQNEQFDRKKDDHLAEFADQVLDGKNRQTASTSDEELLGLERTILRLRDAHPSDSLSEAETKRMLVRFKSRLRREEQTPKPSFWQRLFDFQSNPQVAMILAVTAVLILAVVSLPLLTPSGGLVMGTASNMNTAFFAVGLIGLLLIVYWFSRRK